MAARNLLQLKGKSPLLIAYAVLDSVAHDKIALGMTVILSLFFYLASNNFEVRKQSSKF